uniref:Adenylate cyclase N-terminal domain-containing protein n=1 Tax=Timema tahoe TaxID=61484 RepID=A0A7R9IPX3_9NEOP|nr:unnamed protein product [Timema tahoe]
MQRQFRNKNLDELYYQYQQRLQHGYFSVFLLLQIVLTVGHIAVVIAAQDGLENTLPDVISYCVLTLLCCPLVLVVFKEKLVDKYPFVPFVSSCLVIVFLVVADLAVGIYHAGDEYLLLVLRPAYSTHALLACYMFLPLLHNFQPIILGATVTLCHLVTLGVIVYKDVPDVLQRVSSESCVKVTRNLCPPGIPTDLFLCRPVVTSAPLVFQVISDAIYLVCVNGLGLYFRLLNEVSIRRTFLDRRACIESKYKVDYEKQQEEHLLLSILPRHIVEDVKEDIRRIIQHVNDPLKKKPFSVTRDTAVTEMPSFTKKTKFGSSRTFISGGRWLHGPHRTAQKCGAMLSRRYVRADAVRTIIIYKMIVFGSEVSPVDLRILHDFATVALHASSRANPVAELSFRRFVDKKLL